jgi:amino acid transporter
MSLYLRLKRFLIGQSLPTSAHAEERLSNAAGLAVLSSDALSSVAYATEEILLVLIAAGSSALVWSLPIGMTIIALLAVVILSYRQTIKAYPQGGGSYIVARENLGLYPGLIAGASLMIDYILTVTVSISAGTAAITSAFPHLQSFTVELCLLFMALLMLANLRGVKESGQLFMIPTFVFITCVFLLIAVGLFQLTNGHVVQPYPPDPPAKATLSLFFILRAFSAGCAALTGVEAISDGVLAFKPPEWQNARKTLLYLGLILGFMFLGVTYLAHAYHIMPEEGQTVVSLLGLQILGQGPLYYFIQVATLLVLLLAANTSYADFPRLCYFLARDGFLPRQLSFLGERLVYSNGIIMLSLAAALLLIVFQGNTNAIIPLYAVGVFTSFTLSQAGMVRRWLRLRTSGWQASAFLNGLGASATAIVLVVIVATKFTGGAWLVVVTIPLFVWCFMGIYHHYRHVAVRLSLQGVPSRSLLPYRPPTHDAVHPAILILGQLNQGTLEALDYAYNIADEIVALHVDIGSTDREKLHQRWKEFGGGIPLVIVESSFREIVTPIADFVREFETTHPVAMTTVIIPTFVTRNWWHGLLHNQTAFFLERALLAKKSRVVTRVRYYL